MEAAEIQAQIARGKEKGYIRQLPDGRLAVKIVPVLSDSWLVVRRDAPKSFLVERSNFKHIFSQSLNAIKIEYEETLIAICYPPESPNAGIDADIAECIASASEGRLAIISHDELIVEAHGHYLDATWGLKYLEKIKEEDFLCPL
jgi:hypothetical protein